MHWWLSRIGSKNESFSRCALSVGTTSRLVTLSPTPDYAPPHCHEERLPNPFTFTPINPQFPQPISRKAGGFSTLGSSPAAACVAQGERASGDNRGPTAGILAQSGNRMRAVGMEPTAIPHYSVYIGRLAVQGFALNHTCNIPLLLRFPYCRSLLVTDTVPS